MKNYLPVVHIGKIVLREVNEYDYLDYFEIGKDFETTQYLTWGPFIHPNDALWVIREIFYKRLENNIPVGYAIELNNKMIGMIDYHTYYFIINCAEIGYILHKDYWGKGIMKKCLKMATKIGFEHLGLNKIIVGHTYDNLQSMSVIKSSGYKYEYQQIVDVKGIEKLAYYYAMYRYEYEGGN